MKSKAYLLFASAASAAYLDIQSQPVNGTVYTLRVPDMVSPSPSDSVSLFPTAPPLQKPRPGNLTFNSSTEPPLTLATSEAAYKHTWTYWQQVVQIVLWAVYICVF
jgi:hypothetical protein